MRLQRKSGLGRSACEQKCRGSSASNADESQSQRQCDASFYTQFLVFNTQFLVFNTKFTIFTRTMTGPAGCQGPNASQRTPLGRLMITGLAPWEAEVVERGA